MQYTLSLSYGKDSLACLFAIEKLGWPLDRIVHAEVWATDEISADPPPMVAFKAKADQIIKDRWGVEVEHVCAAKDGEKLTYEKLFYHAPERKYKECFKTESITGFPFTIGAWCKKLKDGNYRKISDTPDCSRHKEKEIKYLGIAADEPERIIRHSKPGFLLPLVEIGWDEAYCRQLCEENGLLSPIYTDSARGGCWFCHNQGVDQLRFLRKNYPDLWTLLLKWDADSPVTFRSDGHTVHDFDLRFSAEDEGRVPTDRKFRWKMLKGV